MSSFLKYISGIFIGIKSLLIGMSVTWKELWTKKVTMQYPENRDTLVISDRWRAKLVMPHDENNEHACTACGICQMNCPNGTIKVVSKMIETEEGKQKKILDKHIWDNGLCTFCNLCVLSCPSNAIIFTNEFENAVFTREVLIQKLNKEGSKLREKKKDPLTAKIAPASKEPITVPKTEAPKEPAIVKETAPKEAVIIEPVVKKVAAPEKEMPKATDETTEKSANNPTSI
ncbi:MAG: putative dehydrogenase subunit [Bacteroidetes bacterium]|nr:putative dehydrogenase subunit [Bacteroidota bacterium]